jgi:hypothetical protein
MTPTLRMKAALLALTLVGCAKSPRALYEGMLDDQTELVVVNRDLGTALRMRGTYLSDAFRMQMAAERKRLIDATDQDDAAFVRRMQDDASAYHEVVLTVETDLVDQEVTLGTTDDGWKLRLLADGVEQPLVTVYKVREPNPLHHGLYAYLNLWNELWIARFQKVTTSPTELVLKVGSGFGHGEVHWTGAQLGAPAP